MGHWDGVIKRLDKLFMWHGCHESNLMMEKCKMLVWRVLQASVMLIWWFAIVMRRRHCSSDPLFLSKYASKDNPGKTNRTESSILLIRGSQMWPAWAAIGPLLPFYISSLINPWMLLFSMCRGLKGALINGLDQCPLLFNYCVLLHVSHFTPT